MLRAVLSLFSFALFATSGSAADIDIGTGDNFPKDVKVGDVIKFERTQGVNKIEVKVNGKEVKGTNKTGAAAALVKMKYEVKAEEAGILEIEITLISPKGESATKKYKVDVIQK
jgi:hypothetical protein